MINHNEFYFCEQNARFSQIRKEPPIIVYKNRIINHVTITMELIWENFKPVLKNEQHGHYLKRNIISLTFYTATGLILIDKKYTTNKSFKKKVSTYGFDTL